MIKEKELTNYLNGRGFAVLLGVILLIASAVAAIFGRYAEPVGGYGIFFPAFESMIANPIVSWAANIAAIGGICVVLLLLQKLYNFIRSYTSIFVSAFLILQLANPALCTRLYGGTMMCLIVIGLVAMMFSCYQDKDSQRSIFTAFCALTFCALFQYSFLFLLPVFFIGFIQMRAMNLRGAIAALLGIITPLWILVPTLIFLGIMPADWSILKAPQFMDLWSGSGAINWHELAILVATLLLAIVLSAANLLHIINYNLQIRSYNGFFLVLTIATAVMMCIDLKNIAFYQPIVNMCIAIQVGHDFTINANKKRYIPMLILMALAATSYCMSI